MHVMLCLDNKDGMLFNHRRQSQDRILRSHILSLCGARGLWLNAYSAGQFTQEEHARLRVDDRFLALAGEGDYCFVEDRRIEPFLDKIEHIILFGWNRAYPADRYFDRTVLRQGWILRETDEFVGCSHAKITKEVYEKCKK
ncbi:MAG TPA: ribonuclease Z [Candidatus Agathobaculum pullicola]|nr:ribonuclease Z [Candidatus Agathobaculum pullicola]